MQHKSNIKTTFEQYDLSTSLNLQELRLLKLKMPSSWVEKIQQVTNYSPARIRQALRDPAKYNKMIIDAALDLADQYSKDAVTEVSLQKQRLKEIIAS